MALSDGASQPSPPNIYAVYRGFYLLPADTLNRNIVGIDFFCSRSFDDLIWENWQYLGRGDSSTGFYYAHGGLDENTYYAYYLQYVYSDGSKTPVGQLAYPGQAQLIASSNLNVDQLASKAYTTGLVTSGTFQGVIFRTAAIDPKVQMDPTGIWAQDALGNYIFYVHSDGSPALFKGLVEAQGVVLPTGSNPVFPPTSTSEIEWTSDGTSTGNLVAEIDVYTASTLSVLNSPTIAANDATITATPWINPTNAITQDGQVASITLGDSNATEYLKITGLNFNVPSNATIKGVTTNVVRAATPTNCVPVTDAAVRLVKGGVIQPSDRSSGTNWPSSLTLQSYGSTSDLWGTTLTPADVNSSTFGVAIASQSSFASGVAAAIGQGVQGQNINNSQVYPWSITNGGNPGWTASVTNTGASAQFTYQLTGQSFQLPSLVNAQVTGVEVRFQITDSISSISSFAYTSNIQWRSAGSLHTSSNNSGNLFTVGSSGTVIIGGVTDLWGAPSIKNVSNLFSGYPELYYNLDFDIGVGQSVGVSAMQMTVYYTLSNALTEVDYVSVGVIYQGGSGGTNAINALEQYSYQIGSSDTSVITIGARDSGGVNRATIQSQYNPNLATPSSVMVSAGSYTETVIDSQGKSNFVQFATPQVTNPSLPIQGSAWISPTLINSWTNDPGFETAGYLKDPLGFVHLKGVVTGGATGTVAFTFPAGYRPGALTYNAAVCGTSGTGGAAVEVAVSGTVTIFFSAAIVGLSGITFLAEN